MHIEKEGHTECAQGWVNSEETFNLSVSWFPSNTGRTICAPNQIVPLDNTNT